MITLLPNPSPEVLADGHLAVRAGCHRATGWRSQRCHELVAPNETFAARTVIVIAVRGRWPSAKSRRRLSFGR